MHEDDSAELGDGIAMVGMAGVFPGASDISSYWENLRNGRECIRFFTERELEKAGVDRALLSDPHYVKAAGWIEGIGMFDAGFFEYSPMEAALIDPQQRLFLETAWKALEEAGHSPDAFDGRIGVYAGTGFSQYFLKHVAANRPVLATVGAYQAMIANDKDYLASRVAYKLGLRGPAIGINTACSTSLVAIHQACKSLLLHECDMALAGGVAISHLVPGGYLHQEGGILSADGHCRAFDSRANGTVPGSGAGVVVLRRFQDARMDGDHIHAVIRGSAVNNDGAAKVGYSAPSAQGQAVVIGEALATAEAEPASIAYVECHGTGTSLGDPIELEALAKAYSGQGVEPGSCAIGSVKASIGHLDAAAGVAGLIKVALSLSHGMLPPSLNFSKLNPEIPEGGPFSVNSALREWPAEKGPRRAGISSFGIGGTNAHAILEEAPRRKSKVTGNSPVILLLSAKSEDSLAAVRKGLAAYLEANPETDIADVAFTLQAGRRHFPYRQTEVCSERAEVVRRLSRMDAQRANAIAPGRRKVFFMFPGQGFRKVGAAAELYGHGGHFKRELDGCAALLGADIGPRLRRVMEGKEEDPEALMARTEFLQPALFAIEYSLARQWMRWGVKPDAMIGHSMGEYVAACLCGVLRLEDALSLIRIRGRLMQAIGKGAMLALFLPESAAVGYAQGSICLAAVNGPSQCVLSGPEDDMATLRERLSLDGLPFRDLETDRAFHSGMMDAILPEFSSEIRRIHFGRPTLPFISGVTGDWITEAEATSPEYWIRQIRDAVRFADGAERLCGIPGSLFLEIGPSDHLASLIRQRDPSRKDGVFSSLGRTGSGQTAMESLMHAAGGLWTQGIALDFRAMPWTEGRRRLSLPGYPMQRERYWIDPDGPDVAPELPGSLAPKWTVEDCFYVPLWKQALPYGPVASNGEGGKPFWILIGPVHAATGKIRPYLLARGEECIRLEGAEMRSLADVLSAVDPRNVALLHIILLAEEIPMHGGEGVTSGLNGFMRLTDLAKCLGENWDGSARIAVVAPGAHALLPGEVPNPGQAAMSAACKVVGQEYPQFRCASIDIATGCSGADGGAIADRIVGELDAGLPDAEVAFRGRQRWLPFHQKSRLAEPEGNPPILREKGVYLVTGGLGGVGLEIARYLAGAVKAKLVLLGRRPIPARGEFEAHLERAGEDDPDSRRIRKIMEIEAHGGEVMTIAADVCDPEGMAAAVALAMDRFGAVHGAIHAAGIAGGGVLQLRARERMESVLAPKTKGANVLLGAMTAAKPDFVCLFSSLTGIVGGAGQADYCAANAYLDALAAGGGGADAPFLLSINWDRWEGIGMAGSGPDSLGGMPVADAIGAFRRILASGLSRVIVSAEDLPARIVRQGKLDRERKGIPSHTRRSRIPRPALETDYEPHRSALDGKVAAIWEALLGVDGVGIHDNFFALGGHSLMAIELLAALKREFGIQMPLKAMLASQTVALISDWIELADGRQTAIDPEAGGETKMEVELI